MTKENVFNDAIKFASNKKAKSKASLEEIVENFEVLKQKDVEPSKRRNVKKEIDQMKSLAETRINTALINITKGKKEGKEPDMKEVGDLFSLMDSFEDKESGVYIPSIRKLRSVLDEYKAEIVKEDEVVMILEDKESLDASEHSMTESLEDDYEEDDYDYEENRDDEYEYDYYDDEPYFDDEGKAYLDKRNREEAFLPGSGDGNGKHYSKQDLETIMSVFNQMVERSDGNGTSFESVFEYSLQDLRDFNSGKLTIDPDAGDIMKEFIYTFATDYKGNLSEDGKIGLEKIENKENMMWREERFWDIDFIHHSNSNEKPKLYTKEDFDEKIKQHLPEDISEEKFAQERNVYLYDANAWEKPMWGLWTSPNSEDNVADWRRWCIGENFNHASLLGKRWHIVPNDDCKVLVVKEDLSNLKQYFIDNPRDEDFGLKVNFEAMSEDYDAIYVPERVVKHWEGYTAKNSKGGDAYFNGFPWDVASCVFFKEKYEVMDEEEYCQYRKDKLLNEGKVSNKKVVEEKVEIEHKQKSGSITEPVEYDLVKVTSNGLSFEDNNVSNRDEVLSNEVEIESQDNDSVKIEVLNKEVESENQANVTLEYEKELDFDFNNKERTTSSRIFDISQNVEENDNKYWRQAAEVVVDRKDEEETILIDLTDENQETKRETFIDKFKKLSFVRKISDGIKKVKETIKNVYDSVKSRLSSFLGKKEVAEEVIILDEEDMNRTSNQSNLASKYDPQKYAELTGRGETQSKMKDDREFGPSNHNKTNSSVVSNKIYER